MSAKTVERAQAVGLTDASSLAGLVASSETILSVCPPHAALDVATDVAALGFGGTFVDGNAISPARSREVEAVVTDAGAGEVANVFADSPLRVIAIEGPTGAASALKMCYAAYTKGTTALLAAILAVAEREGVSDPLAQEWATSQPDLAARSAARVKASTAKAWRFVGEMEEISATFQQAGVPGGFHAAAAEVYGRLAGFKDLESPPDVAVILDALLLSSDTVAQ